MSDISLTFALGLSFTWTHRIILPNKLSIYYQLRQDVAMSVNAAIQVRGLSKKYGAKTAVDGIDLTVERGEILHSLVPMELVKQQQLRFSKVIAKQVAGM